MIQLTFYSYAKVNLGLRILGKRPDGFHDILTCFQRVSLADTLSLAFCGDVVTYFGPRLTEDPSTNLVVRAANEFRLQFGGPSVGIALTKRIPSGAGLGGGSSNAAAVLRMMAREQGVSLTDPALIQVAVKLGSDVPFFLLDAPAAIGEGKGERLRVVDGLPSDLWIVILWPDFEISTTRAYKELDNVLTPPIVSDNFRVHSIEAGGTDRPRFDYVNDFESVAFPAQPELGLTCDMLLQSGAVYAGLAGSGSSLFAIFDDETSARDAAAKWRSPWLSFVCRPC